MDWVRLDLRGINSTRNAWGYLSPKDEAVVDDEGRIFIRVDSNMMERLQKNGGFTLRIVGDLARILSRCLRWAKIIKDVMEYQNDVDDDESEVLVFEPTKPKKRNLKLDPPPKKNLGLSRRPRDSNDRDNLN